MTLFSCQTESGRLKYLMGKAVLEAGRLCRIESRSRSPQQIGMAKLLWKLVARPVTSPKDLKMIEMCSKSSLVGLTNTIASPA